LRRPPQLQQLTRPFFVRSQIFRRICRARAATANGFETVGIYAAGVVAANLAGVPTKALNYISLSYLASRVAYNLIYVRLQDNSRFAPLRSAAWTFGAGLISTLWVLAGMAMNNR
jgi:uncharacterized MAPEG superfamily protein